MLEATDAVSSVPPTAQPLRTMAMAIVVPSGLYLIGALSFFRRQIFSDFDLVFGDRGDARFVAQIRGPPAHLFVRNIPYVILKPTGRRAQRRRSESMPKQ